MTQAAAKPETWPGTNIVKSSGNAFTFNVLLIDGRPCSERFCDDIRFRSSEWSAYQSNSARMSDRLLDWAEFRDRRLRRQSQDLRLRRATEVNA